MVNKLETESYAICSEVQKGLFSNLRSVKIGLESEWLLVDISCLGLTKEGFIVAKFYPDSLQKGLVNGCVYNCSDGNPSGRRNIPLDSVVERKYVLPYDGRFLSKVYN